MLIQESIFVQGTAKNRNDFMSYIKLTYQQIGFPVGKHLGVGGSENLRVSAALGEVMLPADSALFSRLGSTVANHNPLVKNSYLAIGSHHAFMESDSNTPTKQTKISS